jgi:hypothetical protein
MALYFGQIAVISCNCSDNKGYYHSSFDLWAKDNSGSSQLKYSDQDCYIHYCYMINGYANGYICIRFCYYKHTCEESNIINNSQTSNSESTIYNSGNSPVPTTTINKCCLIKNNANSKGYLFYAYSGTTMYVKECTIQSGYTIGGAVTTSYSNTVAGSECAAISNCGTKNVKTNEDKCRCLCSDWDIVLLHKIHIIWTILKYIKLVCYNIIFIKYSTIM